MKELPVSFNIRQHREAKHGNALWSFFLGILLFLILSLILLTSLNNFILISQTRNMLLDISAAKNQGTPMNPESTTIKTEFPNITQVTPETTSEKTTKSSSQTSTGTSTSTITLTTMSPSPYITSEFTGTTGTSDLASTSTEKISTNTEPTSTPSVIKKNPVTILNEVNYFKSKNFTCIQSCIEPSIIAAQLNLTLSANRENFLVLKTQVLTSDARKAKSKVAYLALNYLYKDYVYEAQTEPEWELSIEPCKDEILNITQISCHTNHNYSF